MREAEEKIRKAGALVVSAVDLIDMEGTQANGGEDIDDLMGTEPSDSRIERG